MKYWIWIFVVYSTFACTSDEDPAPSPEEVFIDGGGRVLNFIESGGDFQVVTADNNQIGIYSLAGDLIKNIPIDYAFSGLAQGKQNLLTTGFTVDNNRIGVLVESFDQSGEFQWRYSVENDSLTSDAPVIQIFDDELVVLYYSRDDNDESFETTVHWDVISQEGELISQRHVKLNFESISFPPLLFPQKAFIKNEDEVFVVFNIAISDDNDLGGKIVYKLNNNIVAWQNEIGQAGFEEVTNLILSPSGGLLVVGSKQAQGWLVLIDDMGAVIWDKDYGQQPGKNWFYNALFIDDKINVVGYSNANNAEIVADGWLLTLDSEGNKLSQNFYGQLDDERLFAISQRNDQGLLLGGWRITESNGPTFDTWFFTTDLEGNR